MEIAHGKLLGHGRFEVVAPLGEGGAGIVYEVKDHDSDARLALKTVRLVSGPTALASLKREFRAVRDLVHPNLIRLDELFEEAGTWFFTMELVRGSSWLAHVRPPGALRFDETRLRSVLVQTVEALSMLHARGMVHRDVKPSNVLVAHDGTVKLLDFGITTSPENTTEPSSVVGTISHMAPEQLASADATAASDFYSLGVMLHQALTGRLPFFDSERPMLEQKLHGEPTPIRTIVPDAPEDLASLCDALLRREPSDRPTAAAILQALGASEVTLSQPLELFVGRTRELALLNNAATTARLGTCVTLVVEGASGVGKTELVRHFLANLPGNPLIFSGKCHEREFVPYKGLDGIVDSIAEYLSERTDAVLRELDEVSIQLLPRLFPVLRRVPLLDDAARQSGAFFQGEPLEVRLQSFRAFRKLLKRFAERRPLVLAIDDIHWADADTMALLNDVLAPPAPPPLLLVCTRRIADDHGGTQQSFGLPGNIRRVQLGGLSNDEVNQLAKQLADDTPLRAEDIQEIVRESAGHPLFLRELLLRPREAATGSHMDLDATLWQRVKQLADSERNIVTSVALASIPTPLEAIAETVAIPRADLAQHLAMLRGTRLVKISVTESVRMIEPYHDRIREAVVAHIVPEERRALHARLATALENSGMRDIEVLAMHWDSAGDSKRAAFLYREAAERANGQMAFDRAVDFYRRALELSARDVPHRAVMELALAEALANAGRGGEAGKAFVALAEARGGQAAIELRSRAARAFLTSGHFAHGFSALRTAITAVGLPFPESSFAILMLIIWYRFRLELRGFALRRRADKSRDPKTRVRIDVCWAAAHASSMSHTFAGAVFHAIGTRLALDYGDPARALRALCGYAISSSTGGYKARNKTATVLKQIETLRSELNDPYNDGFADGAASFSRFMLEDWELAHEYCVRAETCFRDLCVGATYELATARLIHARTLGWLGRLVELEAHALPILRDALRRNDLYSVINMRSNACVLIALGHDDVPAAQHEVDETLDCLSAQGFHLQHVFWLLAAGMVDLYRGAPESVLVRAETYRKPLRRSLLEKMQSLRVTLTYLTARAHLALAERDPGARAQHSRQAAHYARNLLREGLPASRALGWQLSAAVLSLAGNTEGSVAKLRAALNGFEREQMLLHAAAARYALARHVASSEADSLLAAANRYFSEQRVGSAERFARFYAPGFGI